MELLFVAFTSFGSVLALFLLTKLMGHRQMSQLSMFDYINGITIGSISAEMATSLQKDFLKPLVAMVVYTIMAVLFSLATNKSIKARRLLNGTALILMDNGKIFEKNLKKAKLDICEFLTQCRNSGYFDIANIQTALMETNGKISFLPVCGQRPATPTDLNLFPKQEKAVANVIMDGKILKNNLQATGHDQKWLEKQLHAQGISKISDVFLATCDSENQCSLYVKINGKGSQDIFE